MVAVTQWAEVWCFILLVSRSLALDPIHDGMDHRHSQRLKREIHIPIILAQQATSLHRRGKTGATGIGGDLDASYNVLIKIGGVLAPVVLDTGSSDLWVLSDACTMCCGARAPMYPQSTFNSTGLDVSLLYGDSSTGTYAYGVIGTDIVGLAGMRVAGQHFAAINQTNADIHQFGSSGILGLGFPFNRSAKFIVLHKFINGILSVIWRTLFVPQYLDFYLNRRPSHTTYHIVRDARSLSDLVFESYPRIAPFLGRLISTHEIEPMFALTLQRDTIDIGGNVGQLSIGGLPPGVQNTSLTWVSVRGYTQSQGGLPPPPDSPNEVYPIAWEIPIDNVYLDEEVLPRSNLSSLDIGLSALVDTGSSLIRGPKDVVTEIARRLGTPFPCSEAHTLSFSIAGKLFQVDPRDLISPAHANSTTWCAVKVVATDPPVVGGYLFSWSLGIPFLKSVLSVYYFGDFKIYTSVNTERTKDLGKVSPIDEELTGSNRAKVNEIKECV
ncbi:acid protease [Macrolepiota fuliginosa MF-IS2]|uniref:Acid protease n=1 Tax=Macrolepiota fuliginosa MF-IS2 TaxID=1400762 RepID=A0A9P5X4U6_9AGAR|nr:acid protease [Macrolepiota fuliginosa MF-IS2]